MTIDATRLAVPGLTDGIAVRVTFPEPGQDLVQYHLYAVRGDHALDWAYGPDLPDATALQLARKAIAKFEAAVG
ncbi:hypothetical protein AB0F43_29725 [Kribbella sp. NPDC023972]|uniref:hypothetical protein n=1 Tax=Kribbella sp. NPDC023972 TaxID=3154795 RepID=UPI0033F96C5E